MKSKLSVIFISLIIYSISTFAQGEAALTVLTLTQSPQSFGMGQTGVSVTFDDPLAFYNNPAILGIQAQKINFSSTVFTQKNDWLGIPRINYHVFGFTVGYNLKNTLKFLPISVGLGYSDAKFEYGKFQVNTPGNPSGNGLYASSYDSYKTYSIGASINYYINLSLGLSIKSVKSIMRGEVSASEAYYPGIEAEKTMIDYGLLINVPISQLMMKNVKWSIGNGSYLTPKTNFAMGYSVSSIGDEIYYVDPEQKDPLPRTAKLGYNINLGINLGHNDSQINLIDYYFIAEAEDILIERTNILYTSSGGTFEAYPNSVEYQAPLSDLNFTKNLIELKGDDRIVVHKANSFEFLETVKLTSGSYYGHNYIAFPKSSGVVVSTKGIFKLLRMCSQNEIIKFISEHIELEYVQSKNFESSSYETDFSCINLYLKRFYL